MSSMDRFKEELDSALERVRSAKSNQTDADAEGDAKIEALLDKMTRIVEELDPIVRETFRDQPEKLAEWDEIMHMREGYVPPEDKH